MVRGQRCTLEAVLRRLVLNACSSADSPREPIQGGRSPRLSRVEVPGEQRGGETGGRGVGSASLVEEPHRGHGHVIISCYFTTRYPICYYSPLLGIVSGCRSK